MDIDKQGLPTDLKMIKILGWHHTEYTSEDLLRMCLPFGDVISVQKIVKNGLASGVVTYSNADDAAKAMMKLNGTTGLQVDLVEPRHVIEALGEKRAQHQPPSLPPEKRSNMPPQRLMDIVLPPVYSQGACLRIRNLPEHVGQRRHVFSLLPPRVNVVKVDRKQALVTVPDISTAMWLIDVLDGLYTGSRHIDVVFANQGGGACSARRTAGRKPHQCH